LILRFIDSGSGTVEKANIPQVWFQSLIAVLGGRSSFVFLEWSVTIVAKISDQAKGCEDPLILLVSAMNQTGSIL
jgi:hypothetical protein